MCVRYARVFDNDVKRFNSLANIILLGSSTANHPHSWRASDHCTTFVLFSVSSLCMASLCLLATATNLCSNALVYSIQLYVEFYRFLTNDNTIIYEIHNDWWPMSSLRVHAHADIPVAPTVFGPLGSVVAADRHEQATVFEKLSLVLPTMEKNPAQPSSVPSK